MAEAITYLIPTHKRPGYLRRALAYYAAAGVPLLVADSSPEPYPGPLPAGARYRHFPGTEYMDKLAAVAAEIATPYVVCCADDDFTVPRAVDACLAFLAARPDHASAQGDYFMASRGADGVRMRPNYEQAALVRVDSDDVGERLLQIHCPYIPTFYAVQRTQVLRDFARVARRGLTNYNLLELCAAVIGAAHGKHAQLPVFYCVREDAPSQDPKDPRRRHGLGAVSSRPEYAAEFARFVEATAGVVAGLHGLAPERAEELVRASVARFVANYCAPSRRKGFLARLPKYFRRAADSLSGEAERARRNGDREARQALDARFAAYDQEASMECETIRRLVAAGAA